MGGKREVHPFLRKLLDVDESITNRFCSWANNFSAFRTIRNHAKMLEISCHGLPWFVGVIAMLWITTSEEWHHMEINLLFGLILDITFVSMLKAATRRRRPASNKKDAFFMVGPDKFSFPSGHASRAMFVSCFFISLWPVSIFCVPPLCAWAASVAVSRVLMRRHHVLDVLCGVLLGFCVSVLLNLLWVSEGVSRWLVSYLSDEVLEGASYHV